MFEGEKKGWPSREKSAGGFPSHWTGPGANPAGSYREFYWHIGDGYNMLQPTVGKHRETGFNQLI